MMSYDNIDRQEVIMKIYNLNTNQEDQRFIYCLLISTPIAIILGIIYGLITRSISMSISILYIAIAYLLAMIIKKIGRGLTHKFAILAVCLTIITIIVGDMSSIFGLSFYQCFINTHLFLQFLQYELFGLTANLNALIALLIRVYAVYEAYNNAILF